MTVIALGSYENSLRRLIIKKHYRDSLASYELATLACSVFSLDKNDIDYLVAIPSHWTRSLQRGFNSSTILADTYSKHYTIATLQCLQRTKKTKLQATLPSKAREDNIKNCFSIKKQYLSKIKNKRLILVDDLCPTGSTLKEAARLLYKAGALSVNALVIARTV